MLSTICKQAIRASASKSIVGKSLSSATRNFGAAAATPGVVHAPSANPASKAAVVEEKEVCLANCPPGMTFVVEPTLYDSLEWVLTSPPPIHQFEEPPIIVEIEHLDNLLVPEDV